MASFNASRGDRDSDWPLFVQGGPGDRARPNAWQVVVLNDLSGAEGRCAGATDDEVFGVLGQWGVAGSWLEGRKLAVVRELIRRRPDPRDAGPPPGSGVAAGSGLPWSWDDRLAREVSLRLGLSVPGARRLIWTAWALEARLPGIGLALDEGRLDAGRARMVVQETDVLAGLELLAAAEVIILDGLARCRTWADLLRLVQRAVVMVDPDGARRRRELEEWENARVRFWREAAGTCALMGAGLPTDEALMAQARVERRAQAYRAAGVKRPIEILRVAAYLDLLNGVPAADRVARFRAEDQVQAEDQAGAAQGAQPAESGGDPGDGRASGEGSGEDSAGDGPSGPGGPGGGAGDPGPGDDSWDCPPDGPVSPCAGCGYDDCRCGDPRDGDPGGGSDGGGDGHGSPDDGTTSGPGSGVASEVNLTLRHLDIPFLTAAGRVQRPGEARSLGVLDPALARRLAEMAARHPGSTFCVTITGSDGHAIGHGCAKPRRSRKKRGPPAAAAGFTFTPRDGAGPPGGFGSWLLSLPGRAGEWVVDLHPVPTGQCGHQYQSPRHDPGHLLRHLVTVRDGTCGFPACSRPAAESDFEHAQPHDQGGITCGCNGWACSRSCHQLKQSEGWNVTEVRPGYHQWTTPSGRTYTQEPWRYPA